MSDGTEGTRAKGERVHRPEPEPTAAESSEKIHTDNGETDNKLNARDRNEVRIVGKLRAQIPATFMETANRGIWRVYHEDTGAHDVVNESIIRKSIYVLLDAPTDHAIRKLTNHFRVAVTQPTEYWPGMRKDGLDFLYNIEDGIVRASYPDWDITFERHDAKWCFDATLPVRWRDVFRGGEERLVPGRDLTATTPEWHRLLGKTLTHVKDQRLYRLSLANVLNLNCHLEFATLCIGEGDQGNPPWFCG
jgi:hypothetical protein